MGEVTIIIEKINFYDEEYKYCLAVINLSVVPRSDTKVIIRTEFQKLYNYGVDDDILRLTVNNYYFAIKENPAFWAFSDSMIDEVKKYFTLLRYALPKEKSTDEKVEIVSSLLKDKWWFHKTYSHQVVTFISPNDNRRPDVESITKTILCYINADWLDHDKMNQTRKPAKYNSYSSKMLQLNNNEIFYLFSVKHKFFSNDFKFENIINFPEQFFGSPEELEQECCRLILEKYSNKKIDVQEFFQR